jgi:hypothetical protein
LPALPRTRPPYPSHPAFAAHLLHGSADVVQLRCLLCRHEDGRPATTITVHPLRTPGKLFDTARSKSRSLKAALAQSRSLKCRSLKCRSLKCRSLKCRSLKCRSLKSHSLESRSLESHSLESHSLESRSLKSHSLKATRSKPLAQKLKAARSKPLAQSRSLKATHSKLLTLSCSLKARLSQRGSRSHTPYPAAAAVAARPAVAPRADSGASSELIVANSELIATISCPVSVLHSGSFIMRLPLLALDRLIVLLARLL